MCVRTIGGGTDLFITVEESTAVSQMNRFSFVVLRRHNGDFDLMAMTNNVRCNRFYSIKLVLCSMSMGSVWLA